MFVAPPEKEVEWSDAGLEGSFRFLARVWRLVDHWAETIGGDGDPDARRRASSTTRERALRRKTHETIERVTGDIEQRMHLNTAVSSLMELVNELYAFSEARTALADARGRLAGRVERAGRRIAVAARGDRRAGADALAVRAAHGRGAVGAARPRRRLVAAGWPAFDAGGRRRGSDRRAGAGQRQGARPRHGAGRHRRGVARAAALADPAVQAHTDGKTIPRWWSPRAVS